MVNHLHRSWKSAVGSSVIRALKNLTGCSGQNFLLLVILLNLSATVRANPADNELLYEFDIPRQAVATALTEFAEQADLTLVFPDDLVTNQETTTLVGSYSLQEGVEILLTGTGLSPTFSRNLVLNITANTSLAIGEKSMGRSKHNKSKHNKSKRKNGAGWLALLAGLVTGGQVAAASDSGKTDESFKSRRVVEEIVVTAARRESDVQSTAIAVTALSDTDRENLGIRTIQDLAQFTPGVSYQGSPNRFTIRGVGRLDNALGSDPGVATYVDGTYTSETSSIGQIPLFTERTEVLRGPQGTLFGRNSIGGLVNVITRRPHDEFGMDIQAATNDYNQQFLAATITGPIPGLEATRYRFNARTDDREGFQENEGSAPDADSAHGHFLELQIESDITDRLYGWLRYYREKSNSQPVLTALQAPYNTTVQQGGLSPFPQFGLTNNNPSNGDPRKVRTDHSGEFGIDNTYQAIINLDYELDSAVIKYIGSYAQFDAFYSADSDHTDQAGFDYTYFDLLTNSPATVPVSTYGVIYIEENKRYISHELQLVTANDSRVQFIGGLYYYEEQDEQPFFLNNPFEAALDVPLSFATFQPTAANPERSTYYQLGSVESKQYAAYGQFDISATENLNITVGLRYSKDEKDGYEEQRIVLYNPATAAALSAGIFGETIPNLSFELVGGPNGPRTRNLSNDWDAVSGKLGFDYVVNEETLVYANLARGYKSGGMRLGGFEGVGNAVSPFVDEETLWSYEAGVKSDLLDNTLRVNAAAFYYDYEDQQAPVTFRDANDVALTDFLNIPESSSYGFEVETTWLATENLKLRANYSYLRAEVEKMDPIVDTNFAVPMGTTFVAAPQEVEVEGNSLPKSPRNKLTLAASYLLDTRIGSFTFAGNWSYTSRQYSALFERDLYEIESYAVVGARVVYNAPGETFRAILSVSNLTDEDASINGLAVSGLENGFARREDAGAPRVIALELTKSFGAGGRR